MNDNILYHALATRAQLFEHLVHFPRRARATLRTAPRSGAERRETDLCGINTSRVQFD